MRDDDDIKARVKAAGSSFYAAMRFLPSRQKRPLFTLYAFCRHLDDISDDDTISAGERMGLLEQEGKHLTALYEEQDYCGTDPLKRELRWMVKACPVPFDDMNAILKGMMMDAEKVIIAPTEQQLDNYCDHVASAVGRVWLAIFGDYHDDAHHYAHHLGRALQLTNILRDVDEDAARGRLYLPRELLLQERLQWDDLNELLRHPRLTRVGHQLAQQAQHHFASARAWEGKLNKRAVRHSRIMADVYGSYLKKMQKRGWQKRTIIRLSRWRLAFYVVRHHFFGFG